MPFFHILHCEHTTADSVLIDRTLRRLRPSVAYHRVDSEIAFHKALDVERPELILCEYTVPGFGGLAVLLIAQQNSPAVPFIVVSGTIGEKSAIESLRQGATDYALKDRIARPLPAVARALRASEMRHQEVAAAWPSHFIDGCSRRRGHDAWHHGGHCRGDGCTWRGSSSRGAAHPPLRGNESAAGARCGRRGCAGCVTGAADARVLSRPIAASARGVLIRTVEQPAAREQLTTSQLDQSGWLRLRRSPAHTVAAACRAGRFAHDCVGTAA